MVEGKSQRGRKEVKMIPRFWLEKIPGPLMGWRDRKSGGCWFIAGAKSS